MSSIVQLGDWIKFQSLNEGAGGSSNAPCPFDMTLTAEGSNYRLTIYPGTINGIVPDNYLSGILISQGGAHYIYASCTTSNGSITSATLEAYSIPQTPSLPTINYPPSTLKILIGIIIGSTEYRVANCSNFTVSSVEVFRLSKASPVQGMMPYDIYYNWNIA